MPQQFQLLRKLRIKPRSALVNLLEKLQATGKVQIRPKQGSSRGRYEFRNGKHVIFLKSNADEEVLAHEALHGLMAARGFRCAVTANTNKDIPQIMGGLSNILEQRLMFPLFVELGYKPTRFIDSSGSMTEGIRQAKEEHERLRDAGRSTAGWEARILLRDLECHQPYAFPSSPEAYIELGEELAGLRRRAEQLRQLVEDSPMETPEQFCRVVEAAMRVLGFDVKHAEPFELDTG